MKRDWEIIRKLLTDIEEEKDIFAEVKPPINVRSDMHEDADEKCEREIKKRLISEHLELIIEAGFVAGIHLKRSVDGMFSIGYASPRLTMAGHDFLDTMRSKTMWESIKSTAKTKGLELTIEAIKQLGAYCLKQALGG